MRSEILKWGGMLRFEFGEGLKPGREGMNPRGVPDV
jgi:hypothetical protein